MGIDGRTRLLHKAFNDSYTQDRHATHHLNIFPRNIGFCKESDLIICWVGYSPISIYKKRHLNQCIRNSHLNPDKIIQYQRNISHNLFNDERYLQMYTKIYK